MSPSGQRLNELTSVSRLAKLKLPARFTGNVLNAVSQATEESTSNLGADLFINFFMTFEMKGIIWEFSLDRLQSCSTLRANFSDICEATNCVKAFKLLEITRMCLLNVHQNIASSLLTSHRGVVFQLETLIDR